MEESDLIEFQLKLFLRSSYFSTFFLCLESYLCADY